MPRLLSLLLGLALFVSMGLGVAAHAAEQMCIPGVEASAGAGHVEGDSDQVPADAEKGYPHHHGGCHGHHVAMPFDTEPQSVSVASAARLRPGMFAAAPDKAAETALRPPIA